MPLTSDEATNPGHPSDPYAGWPRQAPPRPPVAGDPRYAGQPPFAGQPPYGAGPYGGAPWGRPPYPPAPPPRRRGAGTLVAVVVVIALLVGGLGVAGGQLVGLATEAVSPRSALPTSPLPDVPAPGSGPGGATANGAVSWSAVAAAVNPGVVNIETRVSGGVGAGTGMVLTADGRILTNSHVVDGASQIVVTTVTDGQEYRATVVGADPDEDVAVLQLSGATDLTTIPLGNSDDVAVGDPVAAIGNAGGQGGTPDVAPGRVLNLDQTITATDQRGGNAETLVGLIEVAANVQPGDSGGPLADASGRVVGMDTAASADQGRYRTTENTGYAIPINHALEVARGLVAEPNGSGGGAGRTPAPGRLGVRVLPGTAGGAEIADVEQGSAAAAAGLQPGDVITAIDGTAVRTPGDLTTALQGKAAGAQVTLTWTGSAGRRRAAVTLG